MISFEIPERIQQTITMMTTVAESMMRPVSRQMDENEHEIPWDYITFMHNAMRAMGGALVPSEDKKEEGEEDKEPKSKLIIGGVTNEV